MIAAESWEREGAEGDRQQPSSFSNQEAPLQNYFTLPFALYLRPLPHVSFLAHQDSADSSESDFNDGASTSSKSNNYWAGTHQLKPVVQTVPPHSLSTISILLERTGCLEGIPLWSKLIALLEEADDDPHFGNLRDFFDARFDSEGRLIQTKKDEGQAEDEKERGLFKGTSLFSKRGGSFAKRRPSNSKSFSAALRAEETRKNGALLGRTKSKNRSGRSPDEQDLDDGSSVGEEVRSQDSSKSRLRSQSQQKSRNQPGPPYHFAPEVNVLRSSSNVFRGVGSDKSGRMQESVRFKVRLDLHNVNLAPAPPRVPAIIHSRNSIRSKSRQQSSRLASSPDSRLRDRGEIHRVTSLGASSDHILAGGTSLHPVISPISIRSQQLSDESHSDELNGVNPRQRGHSENVVFSQTKKYEAGLNKHSSFNAAARTLTESSTAANLTTEYATSSEPAYDEGRYNPTRKASTSHSFTGNSDNQRRPSIIQRLMGFGGRKGLGGARRRSATTSSSIWSNPSTDDAHNGPEQSSNTQSEAAPERTHSRLPLEQLQIADSVPPSDNFLANSPTMIDSRTRQSFSAMSQGPIVEHSDWSNEEALDTAEDEGSVGSSSGFIGKLSKRRTSSSGALPILTAPSIGAIGLTSSDLRPVQEDRVTDSVSVFSGNYHDDADIEEEEEDDAKEAESSSIWQRGDDFLSLLRLATEVTLQLKGKQQGPSEELAEPDARSPKSSSTVSESANTPPYSTEMQLQDDKWKADSILGPFLQKGLEENPESWWLCGSADPLPISFACALSSSLGWQGIMKLCYGKESRCDKSGMFASLGKAADLEGKLQDESSKVRNWAQDVSKSNVGSPSLQDDSAAVKSLNGDEHSSYPSAEKQGTSTDTSMTVRDSPTIHSAAFEASNNGSVHASEFEKGPREGKLAQWIRKMPGRSLSNTFDQANPSDLYPSEHVKDNIAKEEDNRTWQDWADLLSSIFAWMEEYEACRVRNGLAREVDQSQNLAPEGKTGEAEVDEEGARSSLLEEKVSYTSLASYQVPRCVILDAIEFNNGFRRRHGIPEGLPVGPDGQEQGNYRWARSKLTAGQFATPLLLATGSLSYSFRQLATSDWTFASSWELDYLEMCVFHSDIISTRFPSPSTNIVPSDQVYQPLKEDVEATRRATACPYPRDSAWDANEWQRWLLKVQNGMILVPAVSWQAWWTLIAVLNGADGLGRAIDLQVKAAEEPFSALDDLQSIYI
ncbi:hypothetical protein CBS101457_006250 [Exobasidium rhododendri]|nr:hypothetical protein CBS101457_006250 [Exobasidium rhododendri]